MAGNEPTLVIDNDETRKAAGYKEINPTNKFPLLETPEGNLAESHAIAKFLASGHATLMGANPTERAQVEQWMYWLQSGPQQSAYPAIMAITGRSSEVTQSQFNESVKALKETLRAVDQALTGDWLVGNQVTVADIVLAASKSLAFQLILDQGFTKAAPKACAWFTRVSSLPDFVAIFGKIKMAKKSLKPICKSEEKPAKKAQAAAGGSAKPAADAPPAKVINPLDQLPPTNFDIYNFKTYFVNVPDKKTDGHEGMMSQVDRDGWSFWYLHYEKVGKEGTVQYMFENLLEGFIARLEGFKKYSFGKICMLGEEPSLEIQGVLLIRGQVIAQELIDHPQFEYMQPRKLDLAEAKDLVLIRDFFASKTGEGEVNGLKCTISSWHK